DGPADRDEMFKAFGFEDDEGVRPPGGDDDGHRGFMSFDEEGEGGPEGGLNNFFAAGPGGGEGDRGDGDDPMTGGAKDFFFAARPGTEDAQAEEPTQESQSRPAQQSEEAPPPSFFNPTETTQAAETETPQSGFFKPEAEPSSAGDEQAPKTAFFANAAAPTPTSGSTARPSFFNPGGVTNSFFGGSGNNAFQADSDLDRDSEQEFESNND
ncbi:uncharacterized protein METZ01_LOCUS374514, partial [marine metagenome]